MKNPRERIKNPQKSPKSMTGLKPLKYPQATGRDASAIRMLWVGYGIVLISRMIGEVDRVLTHPRV